MRQVPRDLITAIIQLRSPHSIVQPYKKSLSNLS